MSLRVNWKWRLLAIGAGLAIIALDLGGPTVATLVTLVMWSAPSILTGPRPVLTMIVHVIASSALLYAASTGRYVMFALVAALTVATGYVLYKMAA